MASLVLAMAVGCTGFPPKSKPNAQESNPPRRLYGAQDIKPNGAWQGRDIDQIVHLAFEVRRVDLPQGEVAHLRKIWNHVDELRIDPSLAGRLIRNGIRAGVMKSDAWPAVQTILKVAEARQGTQELLVQSGVPLTIIINPITPGESIFNYSQSKGLVGKTFQGGNKLLSVDYSFRLFFGGCTDVRLNMEVRNDLGTTVWERVGETVRQVRAYDRHVYNDLAVAVTLLPTEYLVIGPSERADRNYLVGSQFFTDTDVQQRGFETVFFITPRSYREPSNG